MGDGEGHNRPGRAPAEFFRGSRFASLLLFFFFNLLKTVFSKLWLQIHTNIPGKLFRDSLQ